MHPYLSSGAGIGHGRQCLFGLIFAVAFAVFLGGSGLTSSAQADVPLTNTPYHIQFRHSDKCLDNPGGTNTESMPLQQFDCYSWADNELWRLEKGYHDGHRQYYYIRNHQSNKCVNIAYASFADGASVVQFTCGNHSNALFALTRTNEDHYKLMNYKSQKCLNVAYGSADNQAKIIQYACSGYWGQSDWNMQVRFLKLR